VTVPLRRRLLLAFVGIGTLPVAVALVVLAVTLRSAASPAGARASLDEIAGSGGTLIAALDTAALSPAAREALRAHSETIARRTRLAHRAEVLTRAAAGALAIVTLAVAALVVVGSLVLARRWARAVSAPIEELVDWLGRVERGEPLPEPRVAGAPEFAALRVAVRQLAEALERVRQQEREQERLTAFRETARQVAHEMRGPLSAARLALRQLSSGDPAAGVLDDETARLETMAREFAEFGRLPEGPEAPVDIGELVTGVITAAVPPATCPVERNVEPNLIVRGHYEPLRRATENLVRNAVAYSGAAGITITARRAPAGIELVVRDHGPGVPDEMKERIFEPYVTTRAGGTGLGLALARQTVLAHGGRVRVHDAPGGGAEFVVTLPEPS
jgi:two-component system, NtrC family, nitrogen regulation sensor histidine kinase NtrY